MMCEGCLQCLNKGGLVALRGAENSDDRLRLECLSEEKARDCPFACIHDGGFFCECPIRQFFAQKLHHV